MADQKTGPIRPNVGRRILIFGILFAFGFAFLIWLLGPLLSHFTDTLILRNDISWYYWKLPARDFIGMTAAWGLYLTHQFLIWIAIFYAQRDKNGFRSTLVRGIPKYTFYVLIITVVFVFMHLIQTHFFYDGLAQDTPILSSQGSVIVMLAIILILENPRRGLFLGRKAGKPFTTEVVGFFRRSHMYIFAWALVYTFWFHPMDTDPQLISGFFYMFLLFTQMVLAWTPVHLNQRWIVLLESYVAIHAVIVAAWNTDFFGGSVIWPMFFTGFAFMFVFTYMYAFKVSKKIYWLVTAAYVACLVWIYLPEPYGFGRSITNLTRLEFLWIPMILYGLAALFAVLTYLKVRKSDKSVATKSVMAPESKQDMIKS
ncbi:MAG: hypothetical protein OEV21_06855 [Thermoplasmata archaeon]|nr:hypothetical protein [Thermoplasmata archaeon]